jgi:endoglucanase
MRNLPLLSGVFGGAARKRGLLGVNLSGAEWGSDTLPGRLGREYTFQSERSFQYWAAKGLGLIRFAFLWERVQPQPGGPLDVEYLALLKQAARWAEASGARLIIEPHNFGRYRVEESGQRVECIIDEPDAGGAVRVSREAFADLWARLAREFRGDAGVFGFDLMNEPHDLGRADWKTISQAALDAIRGVGDERLILVPGDGWSSAGQWLKHNGESAWIHDPADHFAYEAHCYFDRDGSGAYARSYDEEAAWQADLPNLGRRRVLNFVEWCQRNRVRGYVGEFGVPHDDPRWLAVMESFLEVVEEAGMDATYWAAGEWWENYKIGIQPLNSFTADRPQVELLQRHLARR